MNLRDLSYLVALIKHRHFSKAAKACFVSQPALSMQIRKLEEHLGVPLLERNNRQVMITPIGEQIGTHAMQVLKLVDEIEEMAQHANDPSQGKLTLGVIPTAAPYLLPHIIPAIKNAFPNLTLFLIEEQTAKLNDKLLNGQLDAAILALPANLDGVTSANLYDEPFLFAAPKSHKLAKLSYIQHSQLSDETILLLEEGHCLRDQALSFCQKVKADDVAAFEATSLETLRYMVTSGIGVTLMPALAAQQKDNITYIPFQHPQPMRTMGLCWRKSSVKAALLQSISQLLEKKMQRVLGSVEEKASA